MGNIIVKQTGAKTSEIIDLTRGPFPYTIFQVGTLVAEAIAVKIVDDDDSALPLYDSGGVAVTFVVDSQPLVIDAPIRLQFVKPVTANAVGVQLDRISV